MSRTRCIALPNPGSVLTTYVLVNYQISDESAWNISSIELYADVEMTQLLADDIRFKDLPLEAQDTIHAALNVYDEQRRRQDARLMQLAVQRMSMVAA